MRRLAWAVLLATSTAFATPSSDLDRGRTDFRARRYDSAIPVLNALLYPRPQLSQTNDLVEAHLLLGGAHYEAGNRDRAREEFERALQLEPDRAISTLQYSEGAVKLFDDVKADVLAKQRLAADQKRIAEAKAAIEAYKKSLVVYEATPFGYNFLPFGIAQFSQKRYVPGALLAAGQISTLATNISIYVYLVGTYGFQNERVPRSEGPRVRRMQQIQIGTGVAFLGLYAFSVFDAIRHYKPRLRVEGDDSLIPTDLRDKDAPTPAPTGPRKLKKVSFADRLQLTPMFTEETVGIGIGWEND